MAPTQLHPTQVKGLKEAYQDLEKLGKNARVIEVATWITAIATVILAVVGFISLLK